MKPYANSCIRRKVTVCGNSVRLTICYPPVVAFGDGAFHPLANNCQSPIPTIAAITAALTEDQGTTAHGVIQCWMHTQHQGFETQVVYCTSSSFYHGTFASPHRRKGKILWDPLALFPEFHHHNCLGSCSFSSRYQSASSTCLKASPILSLSIISLVPSQLYTNAPAQYTYTSNLIAQGLSVIAQQ